MLSPTTSTTDPGTPPAALKSRHVEVDPPKVDTPRLAGDSIAIRRLTATDAAAWVTLTVRRRRSSTPGTFGDQLLPDDQVDTDHLTVAPSRGSTFGVEVAARYVGCARVTAGQGGVWALSTVYLDPKFRGRGLGKLLVTTALASVPPAAPVELWVATSNPDAAHLYRRIGFTPTGIKWAADPSAWVHMRLERP